ncbi:hypothetical protein QMO75_12775 [Rhodomicrobium lacus]|nr:hypothetical protein [Rhodomicrobium lacus]WKW50152.1 hypothetical protein QMO75_12775 [Rhodomicrobium lacus]
MQESREGGLRIGVLLPELGELLLFLLGAFARASEPGVEQGTQPLRIEHLLHHFGDDHVVEPVHGDADTPAGEPPLLRFPRAAIIAVGPVLAGVEDHGRAAIAAARDASEKRRAVHHARRRIARIAALQEPLRRVEDRLLDDDGHGKGDPFRWRPRLAAPAVEAVEEVLSLVSGRGQDVVDAASGEALTAPCDAALVEMRRDGLLAHGVTAFAKRKAEDLAHDTRLGLIDDEHLLLARPANLACDHIIAERRLRSVPEALTRIFEHGAMDVLGGLTRLMLVEDVQHLPKERAGLVVAEILRDGDEIDTCLAKLAEVELRMERIAAEAGERMHDDDVEGMIRPLRLVKHLLKHGPVVVEGRCAGFREHFDDLMALLFAPGLALMNLVGDGKIGLGLPNRRDTRIDRSLAAHRLLPRFILEQDRIDLGQEKGAQKSDLVPGDG